MNWYVHNPLAPFSPTSPISHPLILPSSPFLLYQYMEAGACFLYGLSVVPHVMRAFKHEPENATVQLQPTVVPTALARLLRHNHAKVFLTVLSTVPGMSGPTGRSALSHAMEVASPVPEPLNQPCTMEESVQDPIWSCVLATLRNVPVCATKSTIPSQD